MMRICFTGRVVSQQYVLLTAEKLAVNCFKWESNGWVYIAIRYTFRRSLLLRFPRYFPAESVFTLSDILSGRGCFYSFPRYFPAESVFTLSDILSAESAFTAFRDTFRRQLFLHRDKERQPLLSVPRRAGKRELYADFHRFCLHRRDRELRQA